MIVVADTSPLLHLARIGRLDLVASALGPVRREANHTNPGRRRIIDYQPPFGPPKGSSARYRVRVEAPVNRPRRRQVSATPHPKD
jgi:hypothetical protein